jgi:outer membrane immunogenic protein
VKKLLVAGIAAAAFLSAPALAQPASPFNWSGFYVGVNGGGMDFSTSGNYVNASPNVWGTARKETTLGGLHGGFQGQWGSWVVGVEGSWDTVLGDRFGSDNGTNVPGVGPCSAAAAFACQARINDILSVGPRVGFAMNQWMVYGTGGYARAEIESNFLTIATGNILGTSASNHQEGWFLGGGLEMLVTTGFIVGLEYKHYDFKTAAQNDPTIPVDNINMQAKADAVLLRLTIK